MLSVSASKPTIKPSFKAQVNSVRYVIVNGVVTDDKAIIEDVSRQFASRLRKGNILNNPLCQSLRKHIPEYCCDAGKQPAKFLKRYWLGKEFNIIVGNAAANLKNIWEQSGVSLDTKKHQASEAVKKIFYKSSHQQIAIDAIAQNVKGKIKYIIKNVYKTV